MTGGTGGTMGMDCGTCGTCGKAFATLVGRKTKATKARAGPRPRYCSDKCRTDAKAPDGGRSIRTGRRGKAHARPEGADAPYPSNAELRRQLRAESAGHRRRVHADPRMIIHCHWCMEEATARLLDPAWRRVGARRRVVLLCGRCARHAKAFMRERGYEMVSATNEDAAAIMERVAAMKGRGTASQGVRTARKKGRGRPQ